MTIHNPEGKPYIHWYYENVVWREVESAEVAARLDVQSIFRRERSNALIDILTANLEKQIIGMRKS